MGNLHLVNLTYGKVLALCLARLFFCKLLSKPNLSGVRRQANFGHGEEIFDSYEPNHIISRPNYLNG